jgi:hypothetical protein
MLMLDRRTLLRAGSAAVAVGAAALAPTVPALARAPQVGKQAQPSFYRLKLGTIALTVISVVVNSTVSFLHPEWPFGFDLDVPLATKARMAFLDRAAADKTLVGSYHLPFPGFGHVVRDGSAYRWLPADWCWTT